MTERADAEATSAGRAGAPPLSNAVAVTYALPSAGVGFAFFMTSIFFLKYATDVLGVGAAAMGWILFASRFWDAVSDPLTGYLTDRTHTRWGRRRPWMLASALPLGLLVVALWSPPASLSAAELTAWTFVVTLGLYTATTAFGVPYDALGAELTDDYRSRTRLFGLRRAVFGLGTLAALGGVALMTQSDLATADGRLEAREIAFWVAGFAAVTTTGLTLFTALRLRERPDYLTRGGTRPIQGVLDVWRNRHARILLCVSVVQQIGVACVGLTASYFIHYVMHAPEHIATIIVSFMGSAVLSVPCWIALARRFEKKPLLIVSMLTISFALVPALFVTPGYLTLTFAFTALAGFAAGGVDTLSPSLQADVIDVDEYRTGERKEGTYFAVWSFAGKTSAAGAGAVVSFALSASGYAPNVVQTEETLWMIRILYAGVPLVFWTGGVLLFLGFQLTAAEHAGIRREIDARASAGGPR